MKQSTFVVVLVVAALVVSFSIYRFILGNPSNFSDGENRERPLAGNLMGMVYTGGPIVPVLICLSLMVFTFIVERTLSLRKAQGKGSLPMFLKNLQRNLSTGEIDTAIAECDKQRGSMASIIRAGLERYKIMSRDSKSLEAEKQMAEVQRAIEEATALEMPILERNLIAMSTIASTATMFGLLGTVIGMIRAFAALAQAGAPDAVQLSIGISEALINTALGIFAGIVGIIAYNFFINKVDNFTYMIDEASYDVLQTLMTKTK
ncbi:MAG TPA: MotA/TolQ/ExbB proton channel family protein [Bacteroidota bacterium]|nr:MotA/TolQ/ExbB proton channel family protein [Bacteroidota bacterium]